MDFYLIKRKNDQYRVGHNSVFVARAEVANPWRVLYLSIVESVIKTVLVATAHCIILHIVVVPCCFYSAVNSTEIISYHFTV